MLGQGNEAHGDVSLSDEDDGLLADDAQVTTSAPPVPSLLAQFLLRLDQDERIAQQEAERQTEAAQQQAEQAIREFETALRAMRYRETLPENLKKGARELWTQTFGASPPFRSIPQGNPTEGPYHWPVSEETLSEVIEEKRQEIFGKVAADRAAADAKREAVKQRRPEAFEHMRNLLRNMTRSLPTSRLPLRRTRRCIHTNRRFLRRNPRPRVPKVKARPRRPQMSNRSRK